MSALNHTAPRFRSHHSGGQTQSGIGGQSGSGGGFNSASSSLPFAQALDVPPRLAAALLSNPSATPLATPLAPPPPPPARQTASSQPSSARNSVRYAGVDHTLGPMFSEEEDGDDSDFIAAKMASLGIEPHRGAGGSQFTSNADFQRRIRSQQILQLQILQQQQQLQQQQAATQAAALQNLLLQSNDAQQAREAMALLELKRAQLANGPSSNFDRMYQTAPQPLLAQQRLQAEQQLLALFHHQQQQAQQQGQHHPQQHANHGHGHSNHGHRPNLAAQLEAGTLRRERKREQQRSRPLSIENPHDHSQLRAAFERAPGGYFPPLSPPVDSAAGVGWTSTLKSPASEWPTSAWTVTSVSKRSSSSGSNSTSARAPSPPTPSTLSAPPPTLSAAQPLFSSAQHQQPMGRFARARQDIAAAQAASPGTAPLAALLSRRMAKAQQVEDDTLSSSSSFPETVGTSPSPLSESYNRPWAEESGRRVASESDHGMGKEPASYFEWGYRLPAPRSQSFSVNRTPEERPVAYIVRQPYGPPGSPEELRVKNFASSIRRQAGLNLGMLNRRTGHESVEA